MKPRRCPTCTSPAPSRHPATQYEGEVLRLCPDEWHDDPLTAKARVDGIA